MPPTLTEAYPPMPLAEITALVAGFPAMTTAEKKALIERLVGVHPTINMEWSGTWRYRRARKLDPGMLPEHVDELIWRKGVPAALGRANPAGFQVLYLADRPDTALHEVGIVDHPAVVADFIIQAGHGIRVAPIGELAQVQRTGRGFLSGDTSDALTGLLNACDHDDALSLLINDAFLLECFVGHDDHDISSHVALSIFTKNPAINSIAYPSRQQQGAVNFAVRVETFWDSWALSSVRYGEARHLAMGYFSLCATKTVDGVDTSGKLHWRDETNPLVTRAMVPPYVPLDPPI